MARSDFENIIKKYSNKSTVVELIEGLRYLLSNKLSLDDFPDFKQILKEVLGVLSDDPKEIEKDLVEIVKDLEKVPEEIKEKSVEEIEEKVIKTEEVKEEIVKESEKPETKLSKPELDELVLEYETATAERKAYIEKILEKYQNIKPNEVKQFIERQKEIAKQNQLKSQNEIDKFADEMAEIATDEKDKTYIREQIKNVVMGEEIKIEGLAEKIGGIEAKKIELQTDKFIEDHKNEVAQAKLEKITEEFDIAIANAPEDQKDSIRQYGELVREFYSVQSPNLAPHRKDAEEAIEAEGITSPGKREKAFFDTEAVVKAAYSNPKDLKSIIERAKGISFNKELLPKIPKVRSFQDLISTFDKNPDVMLGLQSMVNAKIKMAEGFGKFVSKLPGGEKLIGSVVEKIGGKPIKSFLAGSIKVMAEQGIGTGAKAILQGIISGGTAGASGGSAALTATIAAWQGIPVVGQIILVMAAIVFTFNSIVKPLFNSVNNWLKNNFNFNLGGVRDFFANDLHLGGFLGGLAQIAFTGGAIMMTGLAFIFGPMIGMGLAAMGAIIAPVIIGFGAAMMAYNLLVTQPMISSLVPPPPEAKSGTCQPKEQTGTVAPSSGKINCDINAPENNTGIDKANFIRLANQWRPGKNNASECFNDVVNKALCAGVNPQYALWAWLHESGASNYDIPNVEDFGIHGQASAPPKNFSSQIDYFLKLNPGTKCTSLGYWLSFATNYLTGECDPKKEIPQVDGSMMTGEKYLAGLQEQWSWIKPGSLPSSIKVDKGGKNCGGNNAVASADNEYVTDDGVLMECSGPVDQSGNFIGNTGDGSYDPNAPGLDGVKVPGECSVASKVVETKQCGQSWSNIGLPAGNGTICSAGCGPSSVSSILQSKTGSLTPDKVIFETGSPYSSMGGGGSSLGQAQQSLSKHGFTTGNLGGCSQKDIAGWICSGKAVILLANSYTGSGDNFIGHILVAVAVSNGDIITKDPYYSNKTPFATKGAGNIKDLRQCLTVDLGKD